MTFLWKTHCVLIVVGLIILHFSARLWVPKEVLDKYDYFICWQKPPAGHLLPIGEQFSLKNLNEVIDDAWLEPATFWEDYVSISQPVVFKNTARRFPAFYKWTDQYLKEKVEQLEVNVEHKKKEDRDLESSIMTFGEFLDHSNRESIYLVDSLPLQLYEDLYLPTCLGCGNLLKSVIDVGLWVSSGGTKSVLHTDSLENIHCVLSGSKSFLLTNRTHSGKIVLDHPEGGYSSIDVDEVDLCQYPEINDIPWYKVDLEEGDCIYIPYLWFHQVNSKPIRSIAVNFWFHQILQFNSTDCYAGSFNISATLPLNEVKLSSDKDLLKFEYISLVEGHYRMKLPEFYEIFEDIAIDKEAVSKVKENLFDEEI